jgi:hypothetical protein
MRRQIAYDRTRILEEAARARARRKRARAIELYRWVLAIEPQNALLHAKLAPLLAEAGEHFDARNLGVEVAKHVDACFHVRAAVAGRHVECAFAPLPRVHDAVDRAPQFDPFAGPIAAHLFAAPRFKFVVGPWLFNWKRALALGNVGRVAYFERAELLKVRLGSARLRGDFFGDQGCRIGCLLVSIHCRDFP